MNSGSGVGWNRRRVAGVVLQTPDEAGRRVRDGVDRIEVGDELRCLGRVDGVAEPGHVQLRSATESCDAPGYDT